jgi:hypothetical protein
LPYIAIAYRFCLFQEIERGNKEYSAHKTKTAVGRREVYLFLTNGGKG